MSVHLVGGGRDLDLAEELYGRFVAEARHRAYADGQNPGSGRADPRIGVLTVAAAEHLAESVDWFRQALLRCGSVDVVAATATEDPGATLQLADGSSPDHGWFGTLDGLLVGGGLAPAYHRVVQPKAAAILDAVTTGLPYAGFSAGAMLAPSRALVGGWRWGRIAVTHEDNAEDLEQVTVVDGLGLVAPTVEVHTAQWGTLSRLVAAVSVGAVARGVAIDENTVVILDAAGDSSRVAGVHGAGQVWFVEADGPLRAGAVLEPWHRSVRVDCRPAE